MFNIRNFLLLLIVLAPLLTLDRLQAQSFLSNQRDLMENVVGDDTDISKESDHPIAKDDQRLNVKEAHQKILLRHQPAADYYSSQTAFETGYVNIHPLRKTEINESIPTPLVLNSSSISFVSNLINNGEYDLALEIVKGMPTEVDKTTGSKIGFRLKELRQYYLVSVYFHLGDYEEVVAAAQDYLESYSNGSMYYEVYYYLAAALNSLERPIKPTSLVTAEFFSNLSNRKSAKLRQYLIQDALNKGQYITAFFYLEDAKHQLIPGFEKWVSHIIERISEIDDIDAILDQYDNLFIKSQANLRKIQLYIRNGEYRKAQDFLNLLLVDEERDEKLLGELQSLQQFVNNALNTEPNRIGVILPFSHRQFGRLAQDVLDGLEMALQKQNKDGQDFQLILRDSAPLDLQKKTRRMQPRLRLRQRINLVKQQVKELVEKEGVIAIIGPLAKRTSLAAGEAAEPYKVPVICFSKTEGIAKDLPFLFRFQHNQLHEAETIAQYAVDYLSARRFVMFYEIDSTGKGFRVMRAFANIIKKNNGEIAGISKVKPHQTDFQNSFLAITGGFRRITEEEENELKAAGESMQPIIDFDAVFAPVKLESLKIIIDFCNLFDAENAWILSGSALNVTENQLLPNASRLRFVDTFPIGDVRTHLQPFYESHWRKYNFRKGYQPPSDYTIYAYEALEIVTKFLNDPAYHNREALRDAILNIKAFPALTGNVTTKADGEISKDLKILRIRGKNTVSIF